MKGFMIFAGAVVVIVVIWVFGFVGKGVDTASKIADQTVFNADKHVHSYEDFRGKYNTFVQYVRQVVDAKARMNELDEKGRVESQEYKNYTMEFQGSMQMMTRIASDYNKMAAIAYQKVWRGKSLPERLDRPSHSQISAWAKEGLPQEGYNEIG